jgi:hypothetical protein
VLPSKCEALSLKPSTTKKKINRGKSNNNDEIGKMEGWGKGKRARF